MRRYQMFNFVDKISILLLINIFLYLLITNFYCHISGCQIKWNIIFCVGACKTIHTLKTTLVYSLDTITDGDPYHTL